MEGHSKKSYDYGSMLIISLFLLISIPLSLVLGITAKDNCCCCCMWNSQVILGVDLSAIEMCLFYLSLEWFFLIIPFALIMNWRCSRAYEYKQSFVLSLGIMIVASAFFAALVWLIGEDKLSLGSSEWVAFVPFALVIPMIAEMHVQTRHLFQKPLAMVTIWILVMIFLIAIGSWIGQHVFSLGEQFAC